MMSGRILLAWKTVKNHVPLIKFRKGAPLGEKTVSATLTPSATSKTAGSASSTGVQLPVIEDWQLPLQYRRAPLDDKEIDAINSGGAN